MPETGDRSDPLLAFRFLVRVDGDPMGGFSEVSGIEAEVDVTELEEGGENTFVHRLPGRTKHGSLSLRRGLATTDLWKWFAEVVSGSVTRKSVTVELLPPDGGAPSLRWVFDDAFPSRWNGPELRGDQSAVAVEQVRIAHHGFVMEA